MLNRLKGSREGLMIEAKPPGCSPRHSLITIYVGNLSLQVTETELRQEFAAFGEVLSVLITPENYIINHKNPMCHGYVSMAQKIEGLAAIHALEGKMLQNRPINLVEALRISDTRAPAACHIKYRKRR